MTDTNGNEELAKIIQNSRDWFEDLILASALRNPRFMDSFGWLVCYDSTIDQDVDDFYKPADNIIFQACRTYHTGINANAAPDINFIQNYLKQKVRSGDLLQEEEPQAFHRLYHCANSVQLEGTEVFLTTGIPVWLRQSRYRRALLKQRANDIVDPNVLVEAFSSIKESIKLQNDEDILHSPMEAFNTTKLSSKQYPCPNLKGLNNLLGGGFAKKESNLFISPEGGGKTLLGLQIASGLACENNLKGVFISTEQGNDELMPRVVSAKANILFHKIVRGMTRETLQKLTPQEVESAKSVLTELSKNLVVLEWNRGNQRSIIHDLDKELDKAEKQLGGLDFMVFDWLGGGLNTGSMEAQQLALLRHYFGQAADYIGRLSERRDIISCVFMQATMSLALDKTRVDASMISENKAVGREQTAVIGISAKMSNLEAVINSEVEPAYTPKQWLFATKTRKSGGTLAPVARHFEYQRFEDWDGFRTT